MKRIYLSLTVAAVAMIMTSCGGGGNTDAASNGETKAEEPKEEMAKEATWTVDPAESNIRWEGGTAGAKVYSHYGDIMLKEGMVMTKGGELTSGSFVVDMTSIKPKDDGYSEENTAEDLVGHLSSDDFFLVSEHPTASFEVTSVDGNMIKGNLTVRGNTNEETIEIGSIEMSEDGNEMTAMGTLVFDRQKYDVAWEHYLKDVTLADDITLEITLKADKKG